MTIRHVRSYDGTGIHVQEAGLEHGPVVLLSHALGTTSRIWDSLALHLSRRFRVVRFDSRGHGRSQSPPGPYAVDMLGRDAIAVMDELSLGAVRYVGLSQGAMTGMWLAANEGSRIERLVVANSAAHIPAKEHLQKLQDEALMSGLQGIGAQTIRAWLSRPYQEAHPQVVGGLILGMQAMSPIGYAGAMAMLASVDLRGDLGRIGCPTLVISGAEDGAGGMLAAAAIAQGIPHAEQVELQGVAHLSPIEAPEAFNMAVARFLA